MLKKSRNALPNIVVVYLCGLLFALAGFFAGCKQGPLRSNEVAYVAVPQAVLRDRVSAIYNKVGTVTNGQKLEILEHQKRFVKVRTAGNQEGWVEVRFLAGQDVYDGFEKMAKENATAPAQAKGATRAELNLHLTPARDSEKLYQLPEAAKVDILKRATAEKPAAGATKSSSLSNHPKREPPQKPGSKGKPAEAKPMDDWWLVRDKQGRVGWALGRIIDIDVPMEIAQYAEGQRIQACFVLNRVHDEERDGDKDVAQYLVLMTENKDGLPFDFNSFRVFTWNLRRHRYETAYRERNIMGFLPVRVGTQSFDKEGTQPVFSVKLQNEDGQSSDRTYRLAGPLVRRVLTPGEESQKLALIHKEPKNKKKAAAPAHHRHSR